jgi:hypothetical protein
MRKVLLTCAVVAGLFVVGAIVSGVVISSYFKSKFPGADKIDDMQAELHRRFGERDQFTPPLDGRLPLDRIEVFVALRESLATRRDEAGSGLASFIRRTKESKSSDQSRLEKLGNTLRMVQGGTSMVSGVVAYFAELPRMLLDRGMGDGEFAYWYCLTSFAWLGWDPLEHPDLEESLDQLGLRTDVEDQHAELLRLFHGQLRNARRDLEAEGTRTPDQERMLALVTGELDRDQVEKAMPFGEQFPVAWAETLAPYRGRLEAVLPTGPGAVFLDLAAFGAESNHFQFEWDDRRSHRHRR